MNRRRLARVMCVLAAFCILMAAAIPAAAAPSKPVRIGFPQQAGLSETQADGNRSGYTYEYLQELAQYTGWTYEFVTPDADNINDQLTILLDMLDRGEIDLMGAMAASPSLTERYSYPNYSYGTSYTVLRVRADNTAISEGNYQTLDGIRVATLSFATSRNRALQDFFMVNHLALELVSVQDEQAMLEALQTGAVDAIVGTDTNPVPETRIVAKFDPRPFYFVTTQGNTDLIRKLDEGITQINSVDPTFSVTLYDKYFGGQPAGLILSDAEKEYIASRTGPLRVGVRPGRIPYQYFDDNGALQGIAQGVFSYISEKTGLEFAFYPVEDERVLPGLLEAGAYDLLSTVSYDYDLATQDGVALTRPFVVSQMVMVLGPHTEPGNLKGKRLAVTEDLAYDGEFMGNATRYATFQECLEAVRTGQADYCYGNSYTAQYYISQPRYKNLRLIPQSNRSQEVCIGVVRPADPVLISILNKVILSIPEEDLQSIIYRHALVRPKYTLTAMIEENPLPAICIVLAAALVMVFIMALFMRHRTRAGRMVALESERYRMLSDLSGEYLFEYNFSEDCLTLSERSAQHFHIPAAYVGFLSDLRRRAQADARFKHEIDFVDDLLQAREAIRELPYIFPNGTQQWIRVTAKIILNKEGAPQYSIGKIVDIQSEREEHEALLHRAQRDSLTGVYNAATSRALISGLLESLHDGERGALIILDIDHFKAVNDDYGHFTGDQVLTQTAQALQTAFRREDVIGRLGGDEFLIFLPRGATRELLDGKCTLLRDTVRGQVHPLFHVSSRLSGS